MEELRCDPTTKIMKRIIIILASVFQISTASETLDYDQDKVPEKDIQKFLTKALEGDAESAFQLSYIYASQNGWVIESFRWLVVAAEKGHPIAQYNLAMTYAYYKPYKNNERAKFWFEKAAEKGHEKARKELSNIKVHEAHEIEQQKSGQGIKSDIK